MARRRLDAELVRRGLATSRTEAQAAVRDGLVRVGGRTAGKPSTLVDPAEPVELVGPARRFVSRGGDKLDAALEGFSIEVAGLRALDAGASTGGFTDCLLQRGAAQVIAVDVGYGQLAWSIRRDPRVTVLERTNVRYLVSEALPFAPQIVAADLSFISLRLVLPALASVAAEEAELVLLIKPQFEAGRDAVGPGGVVGDPDRWAEAIRGVAEAAVTAGLRPLAVMASPIRGPAGNVEFLLHATTADGPGAELGVDAAVAAGLEIAGHA